MSYVYNALTFQTARRHFEVARHSGNILSRIAHRIVGIAELIPILGQVLALVEEIFFPPREHQMLLPPRSTIQVHPAPPQEAPPPKPVSLKPLCLIDPKIGPSLQSLAYATLINTYGGRPLPDGLRVFVTTRIVGGLGDVRMCTKIAAMLGRRNPNVIVHIYLYKTDLQELEDKHREFLFQEGAGRLQSRFINISLMLAFA